MSLMDLLAGIQNPNPQNLANQRLSNPLAVGSPQWDILGAQLPGAQMTPNVTSPTQNPNGGLTIHDVIQNPANRLPQNQTFWQRFLHGAIQGVGQNLQNNAAPASGPPMAGPGPMQGQGMNSQMYQQLMRLLMQHFGQQQSPTGGPGGVN